MADTMVWAGQPSVEESEPGTAQSKTQRGWAAPIALLAGLLGALFAVAVPLLPVRVDAATLTWPQAGSVRSIEAPLISYAPLTFDVTLPCTAINQLSAEGGTLAATGPNGAPDLERYGFVARVQAGADTPARLDVVLRNQALLSVPVAELVPGCELTVHADNSSATATLVGFEAPGFPVVLNGDYRPQMVGIFSDLAAADGAHITAELDTRFSSTPTPVKRAAIWLAVLSTIIALVALYRLDRLDGRRVRRFLPQRWWTFSLLDAVVLGTMVVWYFIGSTTSDDGYQFGMARASGVAGYMANYFAYFGVPENPVGTPYYDLIRIMTEVSTASPWVRLPALCCGVLMWLLLSREVAPRLGVAVRRNRVAMWTGALGFLTIWLAYDNGLRPEPPVALGLLLTWCLVERAIATRRLLPAGFAILVAAFACTAGPSGVICIAALLAGLRPVARIIMDRTGTRATLGARMVGYAVLLAPLLAAGVVALAIMFADQPLTAMFEMQRIHHIVGPDVEWFNDYLRYQYLFQGETDGSVGRRIGVLAMFAGLIVCVIVLLRKGGRIPLLAAGPTRRILGVTVGALLLIMITPTKWTHHFGVYAGVAGAVAMVTAMAVAPRVLRAPRYRALFAAVVAFLLALVFSGPNKWWYVSSYGIPWWDKPPVVAGVELNKLFLLAAAALLAVAAWWHVRAPEPGTPHRVSHLAWRVSVLPPLTIALALLVVWDVGSFAKAAVAQGPAFSLARSNIEALTGKTAGLAGHVLVETDPNAGMLRPLTGDAVSTLSGTGTGFIGSGVAADLRPDDDSSPTGSIADALSSKSASENTAGTATAALPFGLNPATTPVLGSYGSGDAGPADLTTGWYRLPAPGDRHGILALTAAGRIRSVDADGIVTPGQTLEIEYGATDSATTAQPMGKVTPIDIGPAPSWRNLRVPFSDIPTGADVIRIVAVDRDRNPKQWLAVTPPRVPQTRTLDDVVGSQVPVLTDWMVGLQFPRQRPYDHRDNIAEVPAYRILPDRPGAEITTLWQSHDGGGPLGWSTMLLRPRTLATYLDQDWRRDWGELQQLVRIDPEADRAEPEITQQDHSGLWTPGHINTSY